MRSRVLVAVASSAIAFALGSCGDEEKVSSEVQRALPTVQGTLLGDLCFPLEPSARQPMSSRRRAQREMKALLRALAATPDAQVQTVRMTHNGDVREQLTVRRLAERHVGELSLIVQTVDGEAERCGQTAADELRTAIKNS